MGESCAEERINIIDMTDERLESLYQSVFQKLKNSNQESLMRFYNNLSRTEKEAFLMQLDLIDFTWLEKTIIENQSKKKSAKMIEPMDVLKIEEQKPLKTQFQKLGMEQLKKGHVAVVLLAGGQGTRLGLDGPKGTLNIGVTKPLYLFEIIISKLIKTVKNVGRWIDLYVMISEKNERATKEFFEYHNYFQYKKEHIIFFKQQMVPKVLLNGKIVLEEKGKVAMAPDGNGGWIEALKKCNLYTKIQRDNIKWINLISVDNPLFNIVDSAFLGAVFSQRAQLGIQVIEKSNPYENVGVVCKINNKPDVKEYYEMTKEEQEAVNDKNELCYRYGVILNYLFHVEALEQIENTSLPIHLAVKKVSYINEQGKKKVPKKENGYILERLALDMIHASDNVLLYEVDRKTNFAPIKNRTGIDSIESASKLLLENGYIL